MAKKLFPDDEGPLNVACYIEQDQIVLNFGKPVRWLSMRAEDARHVVATLQARIEQLEANNGDQSNK